jgi:anti-anti-sigma factor
MKDKEEIMLTIDVEKSVDVVVVRCNGRLVRGAPISVLKDAVGALRDTRIVVLDMSELEMIDAGGVTALVSLYKCTQERGIELKLVNPSHFVMETLRTLQLDHVFEISNLHDALEVIANPAHEFTHFAACA